MSYDYSKLNGRIVEKYGTRQNFASAMGITKGALSMKLSGKTSFKQSDIVRAIDLLEIGKQDIQDYFFNLKVQSNTTIMEENNGERA